VITYPSTDTFPLDNPAAITTQLPNPKSSRLHLFSKQHPHQILVCSHIAHTAT